MTSKRRSFISLIFIIMIIMIIMIIIIIIIIIIILQLYTILDCPPNFRCPSALPPMYLSQSTDKELTNEKKSFLYIVVTLS